MRKNHERKYTAKALVENIETPPDFTIRIARTIYSAAMAGPCSSIDMLYRRLLSSPDTPSGWLLSLSDLSLLLRKSIESMTFLVTVDSDFSFRITVGDYAISNLSYFVAVKLDSVPAVIKVLEKCVGSQICIGNTDEKFDQTRLRRSGIFNDQTGKVAHSI